MTHLRKGGWLLETLGAVIAKARRTLGINQRTLAQRTKKENGHPISTTYLNDIEHDRRKPSEFVLGQIARVLKLEVDYLYHLAGILPSELRAKKADKAKVLSAYQAFRRALE